MAMLICLIRSSIIHVMMLAMVRRPSLLVETSLDGVHWVEHGPDTDTDGRKVNNFAADNTMKTIDLSDPNTGSDTIGARYIRFTALAVSRYVLLRKRDHAICRCR